MQQILAYGIVGLFTAAIYAIIGSGLVLTYATTGVFNFAQGAIGMFAAFTYWQFTVGWGWPVPAALVITLLVLAPAFGLGLERIVMRPIQQLGEIERLVVTIALLSGLIALANTIWNPDVQRTLTPYFEQDAPIKIGPVVITWHQAITMGVAILIAIGLRVLLYRTRTGTEMRATVDDRTLIRLAGGDPNRASRVAWILSTQLAAVAGILLAPTLAMDSSQLSLVIVSAYTAAIFGRLRSLPLTFVGAIVVGCTEAYLTGYLPQNNYLPGLRLAASPLLLFGALLIFRHGQLPHRDRKLRPVPVPTVRGTALLAAGIVLTGVVLATVLSPSDLVTYGAIFTLGLVALSYVPLAGYAGQISLCQLTMMGVGALAWAHLAPHGQLWALAVAVAVSAVVGALIAIPAMRISGVYLALATAAFAIVCDDWIFGLPSFTIAGVRISVFNQGSVAGTGPALAGHQLTSASGLMIFAAVCLAIVSFGVAMLRRSRFGRRLIALRDSEAAYATLGGNLLAAKVGVFALSAGIAGLGGAITAMAGPVTADQFSFVSGLPVFLIAVIGGLGTVGTGLFSGLGYAGALNALPAVASWTQNLAGVLPGLSGVALGSNPSGIIPSMRRDWAGLAGDRLALAVLVVGGVGGWVLRLAHVFNGWEFAGVLVLAVIAAQLLLRRHAKKLRAQVTDVPVEWCGVRREWQSEDEEVLTRGIAAG
jgi:branched-chain amino acid transport system permease protein